jgi:LuxR family transcriptional regulator
MTCWQEDHLTALQAAQDEREAFQRLEKTARELGFEQCAYGVRLAFPVTKPRFALCNNYPAAWQTRYREQNFLAVDPTVQHGLHSIVPIVWSDTHFASAREFWEEARSFGLRFGWAQSIRDAGGAVGMLTLARSGEPLSDAELHDKGLKLVWLSQITHLSMSQHLTSKLMPESEIRLTPRERTVLGWTAEGKTSREISDILGVSERVVNFHVLNAMKKLNAANKIAATVRAALLGML